MDNHSYSDRLLGYPPFSAFTKFQKRLISPDVRIGETLAFSGANRRLLAHRSTYGIYDHVLSRPPRVELIANFETVDYPPRIDRLSTQQTLEPPIRQHFVHC